jgi:hypothetical protein
VGLFLFPGHHTGKEHLLFELILKVVVVVVVVVEEEEEEEEEEVC